MATNNLPEQQLRQMIQTHPDDLVTYYASQLRRYQFNECLSQIGHRQTIRLFGQHKLIPAQRAYWIRHNPWFCMEAIGDLFAKQTDELIQEDDWGQFFTREQLDRGIRAHPKNGLKHFRHLLTPEQVAFCIRNEAYHVFIYMPSALAGHPRKLANIANHSSLPGLSILRQHPGGELNRLLLPVQHLLIPALAEIVKNGAACAI